MGKLIKFNFRKLLSMKSVYICLTIMVGLNILFNYIANAGAHNLANNETFSSLAEELSKINGADSMTDALYSGNIMLMLSIITAIFIFMDKSSGYIKNIISKGYSRTQYFIANFIVLEAAAVIMATIVFVAGFISGTVFGMGIGILNINVLVSILLQYIVIIAYTAFLCLICSCVKSSGYAIAAAIVMNILLSGVVGTFDKFIHIAGHGISECLLESSLTTAINRSDNINMVIFALVSSIIIGAGCMIVNYLISKKAQY